MQRKTLLYTLCLLIATFVVNSFVAPIANAASGYSVILNEIYLDRDSMSQAQIQAFLVSKNSALATYQDQGVNDNKPELASTIIYNAAQAWGINPQVLLATMQKEQSLVTKQNPTSIDYRSAMGYGCPDGADCNASYYGFANQVNIAAYQFRYNYEALKGNSSFTDGDGDLHPVGKFACAQADSNHNPPFYNNALLPGNTVTFSRNTAVSGTADTTVTIANEATASLLCYTPHVGPYDSTGYSGSDNFVYWFTQWFGSPNGDIIRTNEDGKMYILGANNTYYYITNADQLSALGYGNTIKTFYAADKSVLQNMIFAGNLPNTVRFNGGTDIYALDGGKKHYYSYNAYLAYNQPTIGNLALGIEDLIPTGSPMSVVVKNGDGQDLYSIQTGRKRYIGGPAVYSSGGYSKITTQSLSSYFFSSIPIGAPILSPGVIVKTTDTNDTYVITGDGSTRRLITPQAAQSITIAPYKTTSAIITQLAQDSDSGPIGLLVKDSQANLYIIDGTHKILLSGAQLAEAGKLATDFVGVDSSYLGDFKTVSTQGDLLIRIGTNDRVYKMDQGKMLSIQTGSDFNQLGYNFNNVISILQNTADSLFVNTSQYLLLPGTLFRVGSSPAVYIFGSDSLVHTIPNGDMFTAFGFQWTSVRQVNQVTLSSSTQGKPLSYVIETPDNAQWLVTNGLRLWIPDNLRNDYSPSLDNITQVPISTLSNLVPSKNATSFIRINNDTVVYHVSEGTRSALSPSSFTALHGSFDKVNSISPQTASILTVAAPTY